MTHQEGARRGENVSLTEVLPVVRMLSRVEKFRLIQVLAEELAAVEEVPHLRAGQTYPVCSPDHAYQAAEVLMQVLEKGEAGQ